MTTHTLFRRPHRLITQRHDGSALHYVTLNRFPVDSKFLDPIFNLDCDPVLKTGFRLLRASLIVAVKPQLFKILPRQIADRRIPFRQLPQAGIVIP